MRKKIPQNTTLGNVAPTALQTSTLTATPNPIVLIPEVSARSAATKKILLVRIPTQEPFGMGATGRKFAVIAAKPLTGARRTVRTPTAIGSTILLRNIAATALAMIAAVAASISTVVIALRRNTMNITIRSTP